MYDVKQRVPTNKNRNGRRRRAQRSQRRRVATPQVATSLPNDYTYAKMIADPFNSKLVPGIFGTQEGLMARVKATLSNPADTGQTCGFILWAPDYTNAGADTPYESKAPPADPELTRANLFYYYGADPSTQVINTDVIPFGSETGSAVTNNVKSMKDPASNLLRSTIVADGRTIASGIRLTYTGALINAGGQYAILSALPMGTLLGGGDNGGTLSVDDLFRYATDTGRIDRVPIEVKGRPDDSSNVFRSDESACMTYYTIPNSTGWEFQGPTVYTEEGRANQPQFFGIAWRGLPADVANPMVFDIVKSLEWRPDMVSGLTSVTKHAYHNHSQVTAATRVLDGRHKGWATKPAHHVGLDEIIHFAGPVAARAYEFANSKTGRRLADAAYRTAEHQYERWTMAAPEEAAFNAYSGLGRRLGG